MRACASGQAGHTADAPSLPGSRARSNRPTQPDETMTDKPSPKVPLDAEGMTTDADALRLYGQVAERLTGLQPDPVRAGQLSARMLQRVRKSAVAHREYTTVRAEDGVWVAVDHGVQRRVLRSDAGTRVEMQRLSAGAVLPWPEDAQAQEILLLDGCLNGTGGIPSPTGLPGAASYGVRERSTAHEPWVAAADTNIYVRHLLHDRALLPPLEARWWDMACAHPGWVDPSRKRWWPNADGVDVLPLRGDADVVSMLVRFAPGAAVSDHAHALDEDCLVLQGQMFLGDILLRTGDYQLAPAGGSHFGETSDVGVLFFFHGALDPVLRTAPAAQNK